MSVQIMKHAIQLEKFLTLLQTDRNSMICHFNRIGACGYIFPYLKLTGEEERLFTNEEIKRVLKHYEYFKPYLLRKGLWILVD